MLLLALIYLLCLVEANNPLKYDLKTTSIKPFGYTNQFIRNFGPARPTIKPPMHRAFPYKYATPYRVMGGFPDDLQAESKETISVQKPVARKWGRGPGRPITWAPHPWNSREHKLTHFIPISDPAEHDRHHSVSVHPRSSYKAFKYNLTPMFGSHWAGTRWMGPLHGSPTSSSTASRIYPTVGAMPRHQVQRKIHHQRSDNVAPVFHHQRVIISPPENQVHIQQKKRIVTSPLARFAKVESPSGSMSSIKSPPLVKRGHKFGIQARKEGVKRSILREKYGLRFGIQPKDVAKKSPIISRQRFDRMQNNVQSFRAWSKTFGYRPSYQPIIPTVAIPSNYAISAAPNPSNANFITPPAAISPVYSERAYGNYDPNHYEVAGPTQTTRRFAAENRFNTPRRNRNSFTKQTMHETTPAFPFS